MHYLLIVACIFIVGCLSGICAALVMEERKDDFNDKNNKKAKSMLAIYYIKGPCGTLFLTRIGHILAGGMAALVVWSVQGPFAEVIILPLNTNVDVTFELTVEHIGVAILSGFSAPSILETVSSNLCSKR